MKTRKVLAVFILLLLLASIFKYSCTRKSGQQQIEQKVFVQLYCDVVAYADLIDSKQREAFVDSVLKSHDISREQFQHTVNVYSRDVKKWEKIFTKIVEELERREKEIATEIDTIKTTK